MDERMNQTELLENTEETLELAPEENGLRETAPEENAPRQEEPAAPAVYAVSEDTGLREESRKVFNLSDGMKQMVFYSEPVHLFDEAENAYVDIDPSLTEDEDGRHYTCKNNRFRARFSREGDNDELFSVEKGAYQLKISLLRTSAQRGVCMASAMRSKSAMRQAAEDLPEEDAAGLTFENVLSDTDLVYGVDGSRVKENIVIKAPQPSYRYSYYIDSANLNMQADESGKSVTFLSAETGEEIFKIPAPFMTDAAGEYSDGVFYEAIHDDNGRIIFSVIADSNWINAEGRVFPVTVDPAVVVSGTTYTATYSWYNNYMQSSSTHSLGNTSTCSGRRIYMKLILPSLPRNPRIVKAEIKMKQYAGTCTSRPKIGLYRVTGEICPGTCTPQHGDQLVDYAVMQAGAADYTFDITQLLDSFAREEKLAQPNLMFKMVDETCVCADTAYWYGSTGSLKPELSITYEPSYGFGTSPRTASHELGRFGTAAVDLQNGNLMFESEDFSWSGKRMPVSIKHYYNSALGADQYTYNSAIGLNTADFSAMKLGRGWKLNYMQSMRLRNFGSQRYVYTGGAGEEIHFQESTKNENRRCEPCASGTCCNYCLYEDMDGGDATYDPCKSELYLGGETYLFDTYGRLIRITDANKNRIQINYSANRLSSIMDGAGRLFRLDYSGDGYLTSITAPDGTKITYSYTNERLTGISYPQDRQAALTYGAAAPYAPAEVALKTAAGTRTLYKIKYTYEKYRVKTVTEYTESDAPGQTSSYEYSIAARSTQVTSAEQPEDGQPAPAPLKTVYSFDNAGNVIKSYAVTSDLGNAAVGDGGSGINPYLGEKAPSVTKSAANLLLDPSFETENTWLRAPQNCPLFWVSYHQMDSLSIHGRKVLYFSSLKNTVVQNGVYQVSDTLPKGQYTFSAYVRLLNQVSGADPVTNPGVYLFVKTSAGTFLAETEHVRYADSEFVRLAAPFELTGDTSVQVGIYMDGQGYCYVDAAQLENSAFANEFNLLANGGFEKGITGWTSGTGISVNTGNCFNMTKSLRIAGDLSSERFTYQDVVPKYSANTRETFTLSGWAKAWGIPDKTRALAPDAKFCLRAMFFYSDNSWETVEETAAFSPATEEWQFASLQFKKTKFKNVARIRVYCDYSYNAGNAYFDDIQLVRDTLETGLSDQDFTVPAETGTDNQNDTKETADNSFKEKTDAYGNALTETSFKDGEFGAMYRALAYNCTGTCGNDLISETDALGHITAYDVDAETSRNDSVTDRCGTKTLYTYDDAGRTTSLTSKDAADVTLASVGYAYDAFDQLTDISRGDGMAYKLSYSAFHNLESIGVPGLTPLVQYAYKNGNGRLKDVAYANGDAMHATYNSIGQIIAETWKNGLGAETAKYRYVYDGQGNLVRSIDSYSLKEYNYYYDSGRLSRASEYDITLDANGIVTSKALVLSVLYSYDGEGRAVKKRIRPTGGADQIYTYSYADENSAAVVTLPTGVVSHSKTDHLGRKRFDELQLGKGFLSRQFTYLPGKPTETHKQNNLLKSSPVTELVQTITFANGRTLTYEYDAEDRITKVIDRQGAAVSEVSYAYDALGQLTSETRGGDTVSLTYDNYGNITSKGGVAYTYGNANWKDLLTAYDGVPIDYDAGGNPTNYRGWAFQWEKGRQLKSAIGNGQNLAFTYNASGIRTIKNVGGVIHKYLLDGTKILRESFGSTVLDFLYDDSDSVCGLKWNNVPYYFCKNWQGDIIAITDANGVEMVRYDYDAWGRQIACMGTLAGTLGALNPFRYRGYYFDAELQMYYLQSRYYDPLVGRFLNADEVSFIEQNSIFSTNIFTYCNNNPITHFDQTGHNTMALQLRPAFAELSKSAGILSMLAGMKTAILINLKAILPTLWNVFIVVGLIVLLLILLAVMLSAASQIMTYVKSKINSKNYNNQGNHTGHLIYVLTRKPDNFDSIFYVGRTTNFTKRMAVHRRNKGAFYSYVVAATSSLIIAKMIEQAILSGCIASNLFSLDKERIGTGSNVIRGIAKSKINNFKNNMKDLAGLLTCTAESDLLSLMGS